MTTGDFEVIRPSKINKLKCVPSPPVPANVREFTGAPNS
jgi:hypothetical protein